MSKPPETPSNPPADFVSLQTKIDKLAEDYVTNHPDIIDFMLKNDAALKGKKLEYVKAVIPRYLSVLAIATHEEAHKLFTSGDTMKMIQANQLAEAVHARTGIDIHPATKIGEKCFFDHGTGIVVGETAEVGSGTVIYHGVTLGAYNKPDETNTKIIAHRHPIVGHNCVIGTGAEILGHVKIGDHVRICPSAKLRGNDITVGNDVMVGNSAMIDGGSKNNIPLSIGNNVKIGSAAKIFAGNAIADNIKIGEGAVITANTGLIDRNIPAYCEVFLDKGTKELKIVSLMEHDKEISTLQKTIEAIKTAIKIGNKEHRYNISYKSYGHEHGTGI